MAFTKQTKRNFLTIFLILIFSPSYSIATINIDCRGKAFHCVNATHFKICVDFGGVSKTVDDFLIPCPEGTVCTSSNYFECEFQITTTTVSKLKQSDVTNEQFIATLVPSLDTLDVTIINNAKKTELTELLENYYNNDSTTTELNSFVTSTETDYLSPSSTAVKEVIIDLLPQRTNEFYNINDSKISESENNNFILQNVENILVPQTSDNNSSTDTTTLSVIANESESSTVSFKYNTIKHSNNILSKHNYVTTTSAEVTSTASQFFTESWHSFIDSKHQERDLALDLNIYIKVPNNYNSNIDNPSIYKEENLNGTGDDSSVATAPKNEIINNAGNFNNIATDSSTIIIFTEPLNTNKEHVIYNKVDIANSNKEYTTMVTESSPESQDLKIVMAENSSKSLPTSQFQKMPNNEYVSETSLINTIEYNDVTIPSTTNVENLLQERRKFIQNGSLSQHASFKPVTTKNFSTMKVSTGENILESNTYRENKTNLYLTNTVYPTTTITDNISITTSKYTIPFSSTKNTSKGPVQELINEEYNVNVHTAHDLPSNVAMHLNDAKTYSDKPLLSKIQNKFNLDTQQTTTPSTISTNSFVSVTDLMNDVTITTLSTSSDDSNYSNSDVSTKLSYLFSKNDVTGASTQEEQNPIKIDMYDSKTTINTIFDLPETIAVLDLNNYNDINLTVTDTPELYTGASKNYFKTLVSPIENHSYLSSEIAKTQPTVDALSTLLTTEPFYSTAKYDIVDETGEINTETSTTLLAQKNYKIRSLPMAISSPLLKLDNGTASSTTLLNFSNIPGSNLPKTKEIPMQLLDFPTIPPSSSIVSPSFTQETFTNANRDSIGAFNNLIQSTEKPFNSLHNDIATDKFRVNNEQNIDVNNVRSETTWTSNVNNNFTTKNEVFNETQTNISLRNDSVDDNTTGSPIFAQIDRPPEGKHVYMNTSSLEQIEADNIPLRNKTRNLIVDSSNDTKNIYITTEMPININNNNSVTELINISKNIYPFNNKETVVQDNLSSSETTTNINKLDESIQKELNNKDSLITSKYVDQFAYIEVVNFIDHDNLGIMKSNKNLSLNNNDESTTTTENVNIQSLPSLASVYLTHGNFVGNEVTTPTTRELTLDLSLNKTENISSQDYSNIINDLMYTEDKNVPNVQFNKTDSVDSSAKTGHLTLKSNLIDVTSNPNNLNHSDAITLKDVKAEGNYENIADKINILKNNQTRNTQKIRNETSDTHFYKLTTLNILTSKNIINKPFQATMTNSLKEEGRKISVNNTTMGKYVNETKMSEKKSYNENFDLNTLGKTTRLPDTPIVSVFQSNKELGSLQQNTGSQLLTYNISRDNLYNTSNNSLTISKNGTPDADKIGNDLFKALNTHSVEYTTVNMLTFKNITNKTFQEKEIQNSLTEGERQSFINTEIKQKFLNKSNSPGKQIHNENWDLGDKLGSLKQNKASQSITYNMPKDNLYNISHNSVAITNNHSIFDKIGQSLVKKDKIEPNYLLNKSYVSENKTNNFFTLDIFSKNISNNSLAKKTFIKLGELEVKAKNATSNSSNHVESVQALPFLPTAKQNSDLITTVTPFNKIKKSYNVYPSNDINASKSDFISNRDIKNSSLISSVLVKNNSTGTLQEQKNTKSIKVYDVRKNDSSAKEIHQMNSSKPAFNCLDHTGKYSDKDDCSKFYICIGKNAPIIGRCPNKTVFSEFKKQCTKNLSHCVRNNQFQCISDGRYIDVLSDQFYYICIKKGGHFIRFKLKCQEGYYLERTEMRCISLNTSISHEDSSDITKDRSTIESASDEYKDSNFKTKDFKCEEEGKFPHPDDFRKYYTCIRNSKSEFRRKIKKCDSDEVFHKERKECVDGESDE